MVPRSMHKEMLSKNHANHFGSDSNIRMAREVLFRQGMRKAIQDTCDACGICAQYCRSVTKEPMKSLPVPLRPWEIGSQDICEQENQPYLVTVCHFSDWIEVDKLEDMFATTAIENSKAHFARFGVPVVCHTDNGSQFISKEYDRFAEEYGFRHTTSSPYHPKGNGRAETAVKVAKSMLKKAHDLHNSMLMYRNTPPQGHAYSPAQRMLLRRTRTTLPTAEQVLAPTMTNFQVVEDEILKKRSDSKSYYDRRRAQTTRDWKLRICQATPDPQRKTMDIW